MPNERPSERWDDKTFGRAFPYGFKRSEARANPKKFVKSLETSIVGKLNNPKAKGEWITGKKEGRSTDYVRVPQLDSDVLTKKAWINRTQPSIYKSKTAVPQRAANLAGNAYNEKPVRMKQRIMEARATRSIEKGKMWKAGRQTTKAAVYRIRAAKRDVKDGY